MKKVIIALGVINLVLLVVILIMLKNNLETPDRDVEVSFQPAKQYCAYWIARGDYEDFEKVNAVADLEKPLTEIRIAYTDTVKVSVKTLTPFNKGDIVAVSDGKDIRAAFDGYVVNTADDGKEFLLSCVNTDDIVLFFSLSADLVRKINDLKISAEYNGTEYPVDVRETGYRVNNGTLNVKATCKAPYLPGEDVPVKVVKQVYQDVVIVENFVIGHDNSGAFLYDDAAKYPEGTEPKKIYIKVVLQGEDESIIEIGEEYLNGMLSYIID
jgi:hypothetical protein